MLWFVLAALAAVFDAAYYISTKKFLERIDPNVLASGGFFFTGIFLLAISLVRGIPPAGEHLLLAIAGTSILNVIATTLVFRALASTDISLAVPMISFTPIFLIGTSFLFLRELPTPLGVAGIITIVTGSYVLNLSSSHRRFLDPLRSILWNRGTAYMLVVAFIYAISLNFDKMVVINSDPVFGSSLVFLVLGICFFIISKVFELKNAHFIRHAAVDRPPSRTELAVFVFIGLIITFEAVMINTAFTMQIVPYVIAIKRMSIIITVLYGAFVFREVEVVRRIGGAMLMVAGAVLIVLSG
jgi:drug/metabolite transporter (DMT)-like permease